MSTAAKWIPRQMLLPKPQPRRLCPCIFQRCICRSKLHPAAAPTMWSKIQSKQINRIWEKRDKCFTALFTWRLKPSTDMPPSPKGGKQLFFSECASLFLICLHFLYCIYTICTFHPGKPNPSLTTFFQKCWETDERIVLTHLLNMNSEGQGRSTSCLSVLFSNMC